MTIAADQLSITQVTFYRLTEPDGITLNLNLADGAAQAVYTVPAGKRCVVQQIILRDFSADPGTALIAFGTNQGVYDNGFINAVPLHGLSQSSVCFIAGSPPADASGNVWSVVNLPAGTVLTAEADTPEGSALTCVADVFGYLIDA